MRTVREKHDYAPLTRDPRGHYFGDSAMRSWRELATDWRVWLCVVLCLLVALITSLLGYD
jgi:UDP-N-acetylmuramyl pentapeptide phosphotransferase/UDP-N-acetylglucosamine-1-phosphate transferase